MPYVGRATLAKASAANKTPHEPCGSPRRSPHYFNDLGPSQTTFFVGYVRRAYVDCRRYGGERAESTSRPARRDHHRIRPGRGGRVPDRPRLLAATTGNDIPTGQSARHGTPAAWRDRGAECPAKPEPRTTDRGLGRFPRTDVSAEFRCGPASNVPAVARRTDRGVRSDSDGVQKFASTGRNGINDVVVAPGHP